MFRIKKEPSQESMVKNTSKNLDAKNAVKLFDKSQLSNFKSLSELKGKKSYLG